MQSWIDVAIPAVPGALLMLNSKTRGAGFVLMIVAVVYLALKYSQMPH
jgi:hypothetical protein